MEDRSRAASAAATTVAPLMAQLQVSLSGPASSDDPTFVLVPQDASLPFRQLSLTAAAPLPGNQDQIPDYVKPYERCPPSQLN